MIRLKVLIFLCAMMAISLHARPWTVNGKTIQAELVGYAPDKKLVWLLQKWQGTPTKYQLDNLDLASQRYVVFNDAGLVEYKGIMFTKEEKEKREKADKQKEYQKENQAYVFDPARIQSKRDDFTDVTYYETEKAPAVEK